MDVLIGWQSAKGDCLSSWPGGDIGSYSIGNKSGRTVIVNPERHGNALTSFFVSATSSDSMLFQQVGAKST